MPPYRRRFNPNSDNTPCVSFANPVDTLAPNPANTLDQNAQSVIDAAVSQKKKQRKLQYTAEFLIWATDQVLTEEEVLPPSEATLCNYAASFTGKLAGGTTKVKLSTVKGWVQRRGLTWEGGINLRNVLNSVECRAPASSFCEQRPPVKKEHISTLFNELNLSAAASAGCFYGQLRGGKILPPSSNPTDYNPSNLPTVKDLKAANENSDRKLRLPKTKTAQSKGEEVV
ncbi:hypothetical protein BT96DRAFT_1041253 [Gymnopus androsaceus JB14]|uniref:Uncharacterized protein n=1 Tax=Gymnopus androsaceus JB14 TaxID=1447944 RepID=A0A6A4HE42_9AGAR|nr:hypothetical protein BT96DRAFT_1041253 [Gymnopus androsaceus JB14]